jgi:hypothetical protein
MSGDILHGAGVIVKVNKGVIGFATGITYSRDQGIKPIYEVDNPFPAEITPTRYLVAGALAGFRLSNSGGLDGQGVMDLSNVANFFTQKYVTLEIVDRKTNLPLFYVNRCLFDKDSWRTEVKQIVTFTVNFLGIWASNEISTDSAG